MFLSHINVSLCISLSHPLSLKKQLEPQLHHFIAGILGLLTKLSILQLSHPTAISIIIATFYK